MPEFFSSSNHLAYSSCIFLHLVNIYECVKANESFKFQVSGFRRLYGRLSGRLLGNRSLPRKFIHAKYSMKSFVVFLELRTSEYFTCIKFLEVFLKIFKNLKPEHGGLSNGDVKWSSSLSM